MPEPDESVEIEISQSGESKISKAVLFLADQKNKMEQELTLFAKEIGDYLLREFFDDDLRKASSQNPNKNVSFRKLCQQEDIPFSESSLRRFMQVAINFRLIPRSKAKKLLPSHHCVLYQVADPIQRAEIGIKAADEQLSVRRLRQMVKGKGRRKPGGGRKASSEFYKGWRQLISLVENLSSKADKEDFWAICEKSDLKSECLKVKSMIGQIIDKVEKGR